MAAERVTIATTSATTTLDTNGSTSAATSIINSNNNGLITTQSQAGVVAPQPSSSQANNNQQQAHDLQPKPLMASKPALAAVVAALKAASTEKPFTATLSREKVFTGLKHD